MGWEDKGEQGKERVVYVRMGKARKNEQTGNQAVMLKVASSLALCPKFICLGFPVL